MTLHPASSRSLILSSMKDLYFRGMVYGFDVTWRPVVGRSISTKFVLPKSVEDLETIHVNLVLSMWSSWFLTSCGISVSCSVIAGLLLALAHIWKLECSGKAGSSFWFWGSWVVVLVSSFLVFCIFFQDTSWMESTLSIQLSDPKTMFLSNLTSVWAMFSSGIINLLGCLWLRLFITSSGIAPVGNCLSTLTSYKLLLSRFCGVCTVIQVTDLHCMVHWPLVLASCQITHGTMLRAKNQFLMVMKCLSSQFQLHHIL